MSEQVELGANHHNTTSPKAAGYRQWASLIASDADSEPFVFRRFDELGALNLLYLQSEILDIEGQLRDLDRDDVRENDMESIDAARSWEVLVAQCTARSDSTSDESDPARDTPSEVSARARRRMETILKLRTRIKEYQEALLLQSKVAHLHTPSPRVLDAVKQMFNSDGFPVLEGQARDYLDADDLVALKSPTSDILSDYLRMKKAVKTDSPVGRFEEHRITRWVNFITLIVAIVFLIGPILALSYIESSDAKLALVIVFTAGFAGSVSLITSVRRAEIFFGSATYAAVLVVFVSNGNFSGGAACVPSGG